MLSFVLAIVFACKPIPVTSEVQEPERVFEEVDLGLRVKWASCNLGASLPSEAGVFVAWGELEEKFVFSWENYYYADGSSNTITKYCTNNSFGHRDNLVTLLPEDDAANVIMGGNWRVPTDSDWEELLEKCQWVFSSVNSVPGYIVKSMVTGFTSSSIFLPASGYAGDCYYFSPGKAGYYWSSSITETTPSSAYCIFFSKSEAEWEQMPRYLGCCVRPVHE